MHWQLWIPGVPRDVDAQQPQPLIDVGLADCAQGFDAFRDCPGPTPTGRMYAWLSPHGQRHVVPADQLTWQPACAWGELPAGRYQLGIDPAAPPRPDDLKRPWQFPGRALTLGDRQSWLCPEPEQLPRQLMLDDDGSLRFELVRTFHGYTIDAAFLQETADWAARVRDGLQEADFDVLFRFAVRALRINYRIPPELASLLRLFTTTNVHHPLFVAIGAFAAHDRERT